MSMDTIFGCDNKEFCSKVIKPREFLEKSVVSRNEVERILNIKRDLNISIAEEFANLTGITTVESDSIFEHCELHIKNLKDIDSNYNFDVEVDLEEYVVPRHPSKVFEHLQTERERRLNPQNRSIAMRGMRYDGIEPRLVSTKGFDRTAVIEKWMLKDPSDISNKPIEYTKPSVEISKNFLDPPPNVFRSECIPWGEDDVLINVSIYLGYSRSLRYHEIRLGRLLKVTDRLILRGSQTLYDLKKSFHCLQDYMCMDDVSHRNPTLDDLTMNKFPSAYFFIHDTFYMDDSKPGVADTSECIRQWASSRGNIGEMHIATMKTKLVDLNFRLGQPYLYQHVGICEHIIVFTDYHLRDYNDLVGPYPVRLMERQFRSICCIGCQAEAADWAVINGECLPTTPAYLCRRCYGELLFQEDGGKRCKFEAVPYFDRKAMDDCGVFLEELRKNVAPVKKEEVHEDDEHYGIPAQQPDYTYRLDDEDDDMSSYHGSSIRSYESTDSERQY